MEESVMINNRYTLRHRLGKGGMGAVYSAFDRLQRHNVALKRVLAAADEGSQPTSASTNLRVVLANEFQTLANLHHPQIIRVLDYGFDVEKQPYFTMALLANAKPVTDYAKNASLDIKIHLLLQLLQALAYLHRRGIIHRDLKPDNALVTPDGNIKVLDFGLATEKREELDETFAGTVAYMAPEIFSGASPSTATDIFAAGVMAFELFGGYHPFDDPNAGMIIQNIFFKEPEIDQLDISVEMGSIVARMMSKDPEARYQDAYTVISELCRAAGRPIPEETRAIRDSYLQAAQFVGREKEMGLFLNALTEMLDGKGGLWLVAGESGVGKTRLLSEMRTQAMVRGALVVQGQNDVEGNITYQPWRDALRRLILTIELSDTDAGVLKDLVPDIDDILERPIPDAVELEGKAGQTRLLETIAGVFRQQKQPVVLILEDLQWASESLDVLRYITKFTQEMPLLIVGSYRDDEAPDLPQRLPQPHVIKLNRLDENEIERLSASMIGNITENPALLSLLKRETEGNVFFLIEVVRTLAEDAGRLADIRNLTLPAHIFAKGIQDVIAGRLRRIPKEAQYLLNAAAVGGRHLDLPLLKALDPKTNLDEWLAICSNSAVLEVSEEQWRFTHEKVRVGIIASLSEEQRFAINRSIAETVEQLYADDIGEHAARISDHYENANEPVKASYWQALAGRHSKNTYAAGLAIKYYSRALQLWDELGQVPSLPEGITKHGVMIDLGTMLNWQTRYDEALIVFKRLIAEAPDSAAAARAWHGIATTQISQGDAQSAIMSIGNAERIARQVNEPRALAAALWLKGWTLFRTGDVNGAQQTGEEVLVVAEQTDSQLDAAQGLNLLGAVYFTLGKYRMAIEYFEKALMIQLQLGERSPAMASLNNIGWLMGARGDYDGAVEYFNQAIAMSTELGNRNAEIIYRSNMGGALVRAGRYNEAAESLSAIIEAAEEAALGERAEMYRFLSEAYLGLYNPHDALASAQRSLDLGHQMKNAEFTGAAWRVLGQIAAAFGEPVEVTVDNEDRLMSAEACFAESDRICQEAGIPGEQALTLKQWAMYELSCGSRESGIEKWEKSREIFEDIGADIEAERMKHPAN